MKTIFNNLHSLFFFRKVSNHHPNIQVTIDFNFDTVKISACFLGITCSVTKNFAELDNKAKQNFNYSFGYTYCYNDIMRNIFADVIRDCVYEGNLI